MNCTQRLWTKRKQTYAKKVRIKHQQDPGDFSGSLTGFQTNDSTLFREKGKHFKIIMISMFNKMEEKMDKIDENMPYFSRELEYKKINK